MPLHSTCMSSVSHNANAYKQRPLRLIHIRETYIDSAREWSVNICVRPRANRVYTTLQATCSVHKEFKNWLSTVLMETNQKSDAHAPATNPIISTPNTATYGIFVWHMHSYCLCVTLNRAVLHIFTEQIPITWIAFVCVCVFCVCVSIDAKPSNRMTLYKATISLMP